MTARLKLAFLASRNGSAFRAAVEAAGAGRLAADIVLLVSNSPKAPALDFARERGISAHLIDGAGEIDPAWFHGEETVVITALGSTLGAPVTTISLVATPVAPRLSVTVSVTV